jgi:hypothetical protein
MPQGNPNKPNLVGIIDITGEKTIYNNGFVHDTFLMGDTINNFQLNSKLFSFNGSFIGEGGLIGSSTKSLSYANEHLCVGNKSVVYSDVIPEFFIPAMSGRDIIKEIITSTGTIKCHSASDDGTKRNREQTKMPQDNTTELQTFFNTYKTSKISFTPEKATLYRFSYTDNTIPFRLYDRYYKMMPMTNYTDCDLVNVINREFYTIVIFNYVLELMDIMNENDINKIEPLVNRSICEKVFEIINGNDLYFNGIMDTLTNSTFSLEKTEKPNNGLYNLNKFEGTLELYKNIGWLDQTAHVRQIVPTYVHTNTNPVTDDASTYLEQRKF